MENVIIIGGGCAGLTAALYCARAELSPLVFVGELQDKGGLLVKTSVVENYPGFPEGIDGYQLIDNMEQQSINCGAIIKNSMITSIEKVPANQTFKVKDSDGNIHHGKCIIIATGSKPNKLNIENEDLYWGKGISSCAVCDGALYKNKKIIVVGGGDTAMEEALFLTKFSNVLLIHRKDRFRASAIMQKRVLDNPKIQILYDTIVTKVLGDDKELTHIVIKNLKSEKEELMDMQRGGLFYGLGLTPNIALFINQDVLSVNTKLTFDKCHYCDINCISKCCNKTLICIKCHEYFRRLGQKEIYIQIGDSILYKNFTGANVMLEEYIVENIEYCIFQSSSVGKIKKPKVEWSDKHHYSFTLYKVMKNNDDSIYGVQGGQALMIKKSLTEFLEPDTNNLNIYSIDNIDTKINVQLEDNHVVIKKDRFFSTSTSEQGIFVAGDVADKTYRQAIVACGEGCKAAMDVISYLSEMK